MPAPISIQLAAKPLSGGLTVTKSANPVEVILAGMLAPPNMGKQYGDPINSIYPELSEKHGITLYPFLLDGVAAEPTLNLDDGFHPNSEGISVIVERIMPVVAGVLGGVCG